MRAIAALAAQASSGSITFEEFARGFEAFWQRTHEERTAPRELAKIS